MLDPLDFIVQSNCCHISRCYNTSVGVIHIRPTKFVLFVLNILLLCHIDIVIVCPFRAVSDGIVQVSLQESGSK